jgi:alkylation response protein AidB-like acyl-CoA dehydrogenase
MLPFSFPPYSLPAECEVLRGEVREFLARECAGRTAAQRARSWVAFDAGFSRKLGEKGWIGMTWPQRYGGGGRSMLERYVVTEELLAAGAPVSAHWIADRQTGPVLLRFGTEEQRLRYLPAIVRGELFACIGMSEPAAGSDLSAVKTRAKRVDGGWVLNGSKIWTTNAHLANVMLALVRTGDPVPKPQAGLSQFLVHLDLPGVQIRPIVNLMGDAEFNEVFFDNVRLADDALVGTEGSGWDQCMAELVYERSGPERYLSSLQVLIELIALETADDAVMQLIGELTARVYALRNMSLSVAGAIDAGRTPLLEASIVKDLGSSLEQDIPTAVHGLVDLQDAAAAQLAQAIDYVLPASTSFSIRGGTREILRGIIARGLGLR